jgi:hypothetical protein
MQRDKAVGVICLTYQCSEEVTLYKYLKSRGASLNPDFVFGYSDCDYSRDVPQSLQARVMRLQTVRYHLLPYPQLLINDHVPTIHNL